MIRCRTTIPLQQDGVCASNTVIQRRVTNGLCPNSNPASNIPPIQWRHSDSHYGFRTTSLNYGNTAISHVYPHVHHHQHLLPHVGSHQVHPLPPLGLANNDSNYVSRQHSRYILHCNGARNGNPSSNGSQDINNCSTISDANLPPQYMWGPPPPYSQPTSLENVNVDDSEPGAIEASTTNRHEPSNNLTIDYNNGDGVSPSITSQDMIITSEGSPSRNNLNQEPNLTRTTKSGILLSSCENRAGTPLTTSPTTKDSPVISLVASSNGMIRQTFERCSTNDNTYDDSVHSAMHIYEHAIKP